MFLKKILLFFPWRFFQNIFFPKQNDSGSIQYAYPRWQSKMQKTKSFKNNKFAPTFFWCNIIFWKTNSFYVFWHLSIRFIIQRINYDPTIIKIRLFLCRKIKIFWSDFRANFDTKFFGSIFEPIWTQNFSVRFSS